ncbi:hypothetical protein IW262DRAFT_1465804 [Armillaria fumosa]|nr:hypothetical protein IW262DRAFT_1465804 [Armillaria fumosa]
MSFAIQEVGKQGGNAGDYKVLVRALGAYSVVQLWGEIITMIIDSGLEEHLNSDDEKTLAGSSPIKSTAETCEGHHTSHIVSKDTLTPCPRVHIRLIVYDPEEGPALKKSRKDECLEPDNVDMEVDGSLAGLEGASQIEEAELEHEEDGQDIQDMDDAGDTEDLEDGYLGRLGDSDYIPRVRVACARIPWECKWKGDKKWEKVSQCMPV